MNIETLSKTEIASGVVHLNDRGEAWVSHGLGRRPTRGRVKSRSGAVAFLDGLTATTAHLYGVPRDEVEWSVT